jgi:hypothetical protein
MTDRFPIQVPSSVTAHFIIAVPETTAVGAELLHAPLSLLGCGGALATTARELVESSRLILGGGPAETSGWRDRLRGVAGPGDETTCLLSATQHIVVTSIGPPAAGPREAQAARFLARSIATRAAGVLVDAMANQALSRAGSPGAPRAEAESFVLGDDWLAVFVNGDGESEAGRVRVETAGLRRFALPELTMQNVPLGRMLTAVNVVRALAYRLLRDYWVWLAGQAGERVWWVQRECYAAARDVWRFWGAYPVVRGGVWVRLSPCVGGSADEIAKLEVGPSGAQSGEGWWADVAGPAIPLLRSAPAARARQPPPA